MGGAGLGVADVGFGFGLGVFGLWLWFMLALSLMLVAAIVVRPLLLLQQRPNLAFGSDAQFRSQKRSQCAGRSRQVRQMLSSLAGKLSGARESSGTRLLNELFGFRRNNPGTQIRQFLAETAPNSFSVFDNSGYEVFMPSGAGCTHPDSLRDWQAQKMRM